MLHIEIVGTHTPHVNCKSSSSPGFRQKSDMDPGFPKGRGRTNPVGGCQESGCLRWGVHTVGDPLICQCKCKSPFWHQISAGWSTKNKTACSHQSFMLGAKMEPICEIARFVKIFPTNKHHHNWQNGAY